MIVYESYQRILNKPSEKIKLSDGCFDEIVRVVVKVDTVTSSERVELCLFERFQLRTIVRINIEEGIGTIRQNYFVFLAVIRYKPIYQPQRHFRRLPKNRKYFVYAIDVVAVEAC